MSKRTAKFVSAIFASSLAGAHLTTASDTAANAADNCLSAPNGEASGGGHWFYRIERTTQRHCWYIKGGKEKFAQAASPNPGSDTASPRKPASPSVADAHAELPLTQAPRVNAGGVTAQNTIQNTPVQSSMIASRWPHPSGVASGSSPQPVAGYRVAEAPSTANEVPPSPAAVPDVPTVAPVTPSTMDTSPVKQPSRIPKLLVVMLGALSVAGVATSAFLRTGAKRTDRRELPDHPYPVWEPAASDYRSPAIIKRELVTGTADDPGRRIEEMLAQFVKTRTV